MSLHQAQRDEKIMVLQNRVVKHKCHSTHVEEVGRQEVGRQLFGISTCLVPYRSLRIELGLPGFDLGI